MQIEASIPMVPYLARYVYWKENTLMGSPISLTESGGALPHVLGALLVGKMKMDSELDDLSDKEYTSCIRIIINPRRYHHGRLYISPEGIRFFNALVRRDLHETLLARVAMARKYGGTETDTIYDFMREVGMDDEVTFDALKKAQLRIRESKKIPHYRTQVSQAAVFGAKSQ